jgi:hypothetical protein
MRRARALRSNGFGEIYFAPPLIALELHAFALKTQAEPGLPALHYLLGYARLELDQHDSALQAFARCLDLQPKQPLLGETLKQQTLCRARIDLARGPSRGG